MYDVVVKKLYYKFLLSNVTLNFTIKTLKES